ncbi:MAG: nuclear transport factor 2 family protein [Elainella sp. C42_A2020_010]|nr:nuclear transport factor 2 family protein [Elainella sp. C42_A2020_010]
MSQENLETIRYLFQAVENRDVAGVLAAYAPEIVIRDAASLPYGGIHHGLEGAKHHIEIAAQTWNHRQPEAARKMNGVFLDAGEYVVVLWRLKGLEANSGRTIDSPVVSIYRMRDKKIIESQMFYADTTAIVEFLADRS